MERKAPLEQIATQLYTSAKAITLFCEQENHPHRSFDHMEPSALLPDNAPQAVLAAQQTINEAATRIQQLVIDPTEFLGAFQVQYQQLACLRWLCHFNVLTHIPLTQSIPYEAVAAAASVPLHQLKSIARMAMTRNFLREPSSGQVAHSSISAAFIKNPSLNDWALFMTSTSAMMASQTVEATERYGVTESKTQTAYNVWKHTDRPFFDEIKESKELTRQFASYMKNVTSGKGLSIRHLVTGYDWSSLGEATVVDLGGSNGHASIGLAKVFPNLKFIVQDLPNTIETSRPDMTTLPPSIAARLTYQHHDFFTAQPLKDIDVFLLRMIIHDWPTAEAQDIIRNLVGSMKPGGKLIIMDTVLPRPGSVPSITEAALRVRDLSMMQVHNSKERELEEWVALLKGGDEKLRLVNVVQPYGSSMSVLEVVRDDAVERNGHTESVANDRMSSRPEGKLDGRFDSEVPPLGILPGALAA
uniref:Putative O-methyltransferase n=1 Tax=Cladonia uncialis subsp. uncialis TaxID=180999 RepID=A0A1Z1CC49_CLAUC|nr:putative sterigmatocystin 8-O-methyltransferase [Cladonia uncialis subsp. uncialis]AUW31211.1 putative O-methyltransferase [Cladonia uncialis subsp. uncialis]